MPIAIMSAMEEECISLMDHMTDIRKTSIAGRQFNQGKLWGKDVVVVFSRWGKVAAASTTVVLIREFNVGEIIFTGVAGAIDDALNVGDIVVGQHIYQHDLDARPMIAQYEIPLMGIVAIETQRERQAQIAESAKRFIDTDLMELVSRKDVQEFSLGSPKVVMGGIATGDQFISNEAHARQIKNNLPDVVCVEMEGGAVAQVCNEYDLPFSIIRTISDSANVDAKIDFPKFVSSVAKVYSLGIIKNFMIKTA